MKNTLFEDYMKKTMFGICSIALLSIACCSKKTQQNDAFHEGKNGINYSMSSTILQEFEEKVGDTVLFAYDSSDLSNHAKSILDKQAEFMKENSDISFVLEGHCDERGTREYNLALGEKRANSVKEYLMLSGISSDRMVVVSFGKEKPAVIGDSEEAYSKNRRVVTVVKQGN